MKTHVKKVSTTIREGLAELQRDNPGGLEITLQLWPQYGQEDLLFLVGSDEDREISLQECEDGRIWLVPGLVDPENPLSAEEIAGRLSQILNKEDFVDENSVMPRSPYGAYCATLRDAYELALAMQSTAIAEWPREYNRPVSNID